MSARLAGSESAIFGKVPMNIDDMPKISIEREMKKSYLDYAMSVIIGRALPDVRDGLKPVHRRILYRHARVEKRLEQAL